MEFEKDFDLEIADFGVQKTYSLSWDHSYGGTIACMPAVDEGIVYFGCDNYYLYALDAATGKEVWKFKSGGCAGNYPPVIDGGRIFFGSYDGFLYVIDKGTRKLLWKFKTGGKVVSGVACTGGRIVFGSRDSYVYCLDTDGNEVWRFRTGGQILSIPAIVDGNVYIGSYDGSMYCLGLERGNEVWRFRTGGSVGNLTPMKIEGDLIFFGSWDFNMYCVNRHTGKEMWRFRASWGLMNCGEVHDGMLYFGSRDSFHAADAGSGRELWSVKFGYHTHSSNVCVHNGRIYVGGGVNSYDRGLVACLDKNGKVLWRFITDGPCWLGPMIKDGMLFAGSWNCYMYRLDPETGKEIWKFKTGGEPAKEKVIDYNEVSVITIITGKGATEEKKDDKGKYEIAPEINFTESEYTTKSEYSSGSDTYKSETGYR